VGKVVLCPLYGIPPLHFKGGVFLRDRITPGERSFVRVLLGGKAAVTARKRSVLTIHRGAGRLNHPARRGPDLAERQFREEDRWR
jgi:hypothetical protein